MVDRAEIIPLHNKSGGKNARPIITEFDPKNGVRTERADLVMVKYKCQSNGVPITMTTGSTLPLVSGTTKDAEAGGYNPFEHRKVSHPTSDLETFIHLLKGSLGTGILAMPAAFMKSGLIFGLFATFAIGCICTYCVHILVKSSHILCRRMKVPSLSFADIAEVAFLAGPTSVQSFAAFSRACVNLFLVIDLLGCCCVYLVFVAKNMKQVIDYNFDVDWNIQYYILALLPLIIAVNLIRNLKYLAPFSMVSNLLVGIGMAITFYYIFQKLPGLDSVNHGPQITELPIFFGTAIFALEGIGVVMPLENNMKTPQNLIGCPGVLNTGMFLVISLYSGVGFFGFLRYGDCTKSSITLNLPSNEPLGQSVKVMMAIAIFLTYSLQFYVPFEIIWKSVKHRFTSKPKTAEYSLRIGLVCGTVFMAALFPELGPFISLVGALCLSTLGLMFPAIIELVIYWEEPGLGAYNWRLYKNLAIISFGVLGLITGTYTSLVEMGGTPPIPLPANSTVCL